jgi:hypothetical protein
VAKYLHTEFSLSLYRKSDLLNNGYEESDHERNSITRKKNNDDDDDNDADKEAFSSRKERRLNRARDDVHQPHSPPPSSTTSTPPPLQTSQPNETTPNVLLPSIENLLHPQTQTQTQPQPQPQPQSYLSQSIPVILPLPIGEEYGIVYANYLTSTPQLGLIPVMTSDQVGYVWQPVIIPPDPRLALTTTIISNSEYPVNKEFPPDAIDLDQYQNTL